MPCGHLGYWCFAVLEEPVPRGPRGVLGDAGCCLEPLQKVSHAILWQMWLHPPPAGLGFGGMKQGHGSG